MRRLISFGGYTFPDTIPERGEVLRTNFADAVPRVERLPGMDGGFDAYGDSPAAREIGAVRARFVLVADTPAAMAAVRDGVMAMVGYGRAILTAETSAGDQRWTWAKVNHISLPSQPDAMTDRLVEVTVDFQAALPYWFSAAEDSPQTEACSGAATTFTVTSGGTAPALPVITVEAGAGGLAAGVVVQRLVDSAVVDQVDYGAALAAGDGLVIDPKALRVTVNGTDAYGAGFSAAHPAWFRLLPGENTIKVMVGGGESADVTLAWDDTWF